MKTTFHVAKMDCPVEEQMVRMKIEAMDGVHDLDFDLARRMLEVLHTGNHDPILAALETLDLDTTLVRSEDNVGSSLSRQTAADQRRVLIRVLSINLIFFVLEMAAGLIAGSLGLVADSLDMLADSIVYGLSLWAVGGTETRKRGIAKTAGYFQWCLAIVGFTEVLRRFVSHSETPNFIAMVAISFLALLGNALCLYLLQRAKSREAHMQASMIFTSTDVIVNIGVMAAGALVYVTGSNIPDLLVGCAVFVLVIRGAQRIIRLSK
jgi:Co/Zn/Cd efflux system component